MLVPAGLFRAAQAPGCRDQSARLGPPLKDRARVHLHAYTAETSPKSCSSDRHGTPQRPAKADWLNSGSPNPLRCSRATALSCASFPPWSPSPEAPCSTPLRWRGASVPPNTRHSCAACKVFQRQELLAARIAAAPGPWIVALRCRGRNRLAACATRAAGRGPLQAKQVVQTRRIARRLRLFQGARTGLLKQTYIVPR